MPTSQISECNQERGGFVIALMLLPDAEDDSGLFSIQICNVNPVDQLAEWPSRNIALPGSRFPFVIR